MKWTNKHHEFDAAAGQFIDKYCKRFPCYIFGAGIAGKEMLSVLKYYQCFAAFIDNDRKKQESGFENEEVISMEDYLERGQKNLIIIAAAERNIPVICGQLETCGLHRGNDFFIAEDFLKYILPVISVYYYDKVFLQIAQIALTERCTLKCKKCAHACYAVKSDSSDLSLEEVKRSADIFFQKVDYIKEFVLIGGEPLLYRELAEAIQYIGAKYRKSMSVYCITTNGTIVPSEEVLKACSQYRVLFRISNYSAQLPRLKESYKRLVLKLEEWNIHYILGEDEWQWRDYGFEYVDQGMEESRLADTFDQCGTICREQRGNKFYYCVMARSVSENLGFGVGQDDYLDLSALQGEQYKKELLEFSMGYSEKGYLDMCRYCHGARAYDYPIPAAEQL